MIAIALVALADFIVVVTQLDTRAILVGGSVGAAAFAYLLINRLSPIVWCVLPLKEISIGFIFAAGTMVGLLRSLTNAAWPASLLFALLCSLNCISIAVWEREIDVLRGKVSIATVIPGIGNWLTTLAGIIVSLTVLAAIKLADLTPIAICVGASAVLLRVIRGAGLRGLAGIHPTLVVEDDEGEVYGEIVRPLLTTRRRDLECYLRELGQSWRDDATNLSTKFTRNRVRHLLLPLLEKEFNPSVAETLGDVAQIARGEEDYWDNEVAGWMGTAVHWSEPAWAKKSELVQIRGNGGTQAEADATLSDLKANIGDVPWLVMNASVDRLWLLGEPLAVQRRVIKAIGDEAGIPLEFKHIEEIVRFAVQEAGSGGEISLPLGWKVRRDAHQIIFETPNRSEVGPAEDYEYELPVPGEVTVCEIGSTLEASRVAANAGYNPEHLLDGESLHAPLKVRNWRAGDRFWPRHTKSPKKVKELLQERHLPRAERSLWPVIVSGEEIVWVRGFSVAARFAARAGREAVAIVERTIGSERL